MDILSIVDFGTGRPEDLAHHQWNYDRWLNAVKSSLHTLSGTSIGRIIFRELRRISNGERKITIKPGLLHPKPGRNQAGVRTHMDGDVDVDFTPMTWREPAAVLLHELFHVIGEIDRTAWWDHQSLEGDFHTKGELVAIAIANLYRLEKDMKVLRVDHHGPDATKWKKPREATFFFAAHHTAFVQFTNVRRPLCDDLAAIVPKGYKDHLFNPFRAAHKPEVIEHLLTALKNRQKLDDLFDAP